MAMTLAIVPLLPLDRGYLHAMQVRALLTGVALVLAAFLVEWLLAEGLLVAWVIGDLPARGLVVGPAALIAIWMAGFAPGRRWRRWGYAFTGTEVHVAQGWLVELHTIVPVSRVQHIDVGQGPLERAFGLCHIELYTAASLLRLPGISRETAEEIRDAIRLRIGSAAP
ncbi:MAG: hypothetical protein EOP62_19060 [Sphingomonadales bacterium]|nr:MAG: hypothetical protein EOP62_19060 [Sphingomonadales bacterium]